MVNSVLLERLLPPKNVLELTLVLAAVAVSVWPAGRSHRLGLMRHGPREVLRPGSFRDLHGGSATIGWLSRTKGTRPSAGVTALLLGMLGWLTAGPLPALAVSIAGATAIRLTREQLAERRSTRDWAELLVAVRMLARELRSGAPPAASAAATAAAVHGLAADVMIDLAAAGRLGCEVSPRISGGPASDIAAQLRSAMALSTSYGVPLAALVDAIVGDVADRVKAAADRTAEVAGPRFSGYVLAALPVFGLLLGSGMGASPLGVLFGPAPGGLLLPAGVALVCAGLLWSARIVRA